MKSANPALARLARHAQQVHGVEVGVAWRYARLRHFTGLSEEDALVTALADWEKINKENN